MVLVSLLIGVRCHLPVSYMVMVYSRPTFMPVVPLCGGLPIIEQVGRKTQKKGTRGRRQVFGLQKKRVLGKEKKGEIKESGGESG